MIRDKHSSLQAVVDRTIEVFSDHFPRRLLAAYITGSYSGGYAVAGSDLDLCLVLSGELSAAQRALGNTLFEELNKSLYLELDGALLSEDQEVRPALKFDSTLVYGKEIRPRLQVMDFSTWVRERTYAGCWLICHLFGRSGIAQVPCPFPDPSARFFGYNTNRAGAADGDEGSTKDLVRATSWAATAIVAQGLGDYITSKAHLQAVLKDHLPNEWSSFLAALFEFCRLETRYGIPADSAQRQRLRALCAKTREFEDYFLGVYKQFLLEELSADKARAAEALAKIAATPFKDKELVDKIAATDWRRAGLVAAGAKAMLALEK